MVQKRWKKLTQVLTQVLALFRTSPENILEKEVDIEYPTELITEDLIKETALSFIGEQEQVAPIHSAKKVDGKRAYEYAREGEEVKIKSNTINIKEFDVEICDLPKIEILEDSKIKQATPYEKGIHIRFRIVCTKGTYIRAIARDFGEKLNSGGYLSKLERTRIGEHKLEDATKMKDITAIF